MTGRDPLLEFFESRPTEEVQDNMELLDLVGGAAGLLERLSTGGIADILDDYLEHDLVKARELVSRVCCTGATVPKACGSRTERSSEQASS